MLSTIMQSIICMGIISILWIVVGYVLQPLIVGMFRTVFWPSYTAVILAFAKYKDGGGEGSEWLVNEEV